MTEQEYQDEMRGLDTELRERARVLVDYLVTVPPVKLAMQEVVAFGSLMRELGAEHAPVVNERTRRKHLAKQKER